MLGIIYQLSKARFGMSLLESLTISIILTVLAGYIISLMSEESQIPKKKMILMSLRAIIPTFAIGWGLRLVYDLLIFDDLLLTVMSYDPFTNMLFLAIMASVYFMLLLIWIKKYEGFQRDDEEVIEDSQINHIQNYNKSFMLLIIAFWSVAVISFVISFIVLPTQYLYRGLFFAFLIIILLNGMISIFNAALPIEKSSKELGLGKTQEIIYSIFIIAWLISLGIGFSLILYGQLPQFSIVYDEILEINVVNIHPVWFLWLFVFIGIFFVPRTLKKMGMIPKKIPDKPMKTAKAFAGIICFGIYAFQLLVFEVFWTLAEIAGANDIPQDMRLNIIITTGVYICIFVVSLQKKFLPHAITQNVERLKRGRGKKKDEIVSTNVILDVNNLVTYFYTEEGIVRAVEGVSFQIFEGEVLGLVGETGCGKSVSALSVLQLVQTPGKIESGSVTYRGEDLLKKTKEEILSYRGSKITMCFQDPLNSINPVFKVGDQISEVFLLHQQPLLFQAVEENLNKIEDHEKEINKIESEIDVLLKKQNYPTADTRSKEKSMLDDLIGKRDELSKEQNSFEQYTTIHNVARIWGIDLLRDVGIPDPQQVFDRYPHELSGGMRQRVGIAIAIACKPDLLIADEPTTALDVTIQNQILKLFKELRVKYQTSMLFITHDLGIISKMCDRVAVMYSGYIVEYGIISKLFKTPYHPYTRALLASIPNVRQKRDQLSIIPGMVPNLIFPPSGCRFHPRCSYCFEPCDSVLPKSVEIEQNYYVACHLYDPKYKNEAMIAIEKFENENKNKEG